MVKMQIVILVSFIVVSALLSRVDSVAAIDDQTGNIDARESPCCTNMFTVEQYNGTYTRYCLLLQAEILFDIPYKVTDSVVARALIKLPANTTDYSGVCGDDANDISVRFFDGWQLDLTFSRPPDASSDRRNASAALSDASLRYIVTEELFLAADDSIVGNNVIVENDDLHEYEAKSGTSYRCDAEQRMKLTGEVYIITRSLRAQAFSNADTASFAAASQRCAADKNESQLFPIIIGGSIVALITLIVVMFFIQRKNRRARREGYVRV
ncbi:PREDICTED: lysosome-associated membrane glycoprotein 1-like [Priapulus caudatus]|uniref:Lysosome-associated membrane glycoprotein 5 n=1 Tax=Priapulus caudatus TaxID=37621 RepID=A0ABM1EVX0_PRICU|nr:PREDICTED: lysosome-associated membrane glycoprotein 1-like [Priapulus caudatus]